MYVPYWFSKRVKCNYKQRWMRWFKISGKKVCNISESRLKNHFWNWNLASQLFLEFIIYLHSDWMTWQGKYCLEIYPGYIWKTVCHDCVPICQFTVWGKKKTRSVNSSGYSFRRNPSCLVGVRKLLCHQVLFMFFFWTQTEIMLPAAVMSMLWYFSNICNI